MATSLDFIEFVCEQIRGDYAVHYKKMFGEFMIYLNEKPVLLVCDNTVYVKKAKELSEIMQCADCGFPYNGAKEHYILDIEDQALSEKVFAILENITPLPQKKR